MADFTSTVKGAVNKATSAAREMAQETTDMKDQPEQSMGQDEQASSKMAREQMPGDEQPTNVPEFDMSPMSRESQKLAGSMEKEQMGSEKKDQMFDNQFQAETGSGMRDQMLDSKVQAEMGSDMKGQMFDSKTQAEMGSDMKGQMLDSMAQAEMGSDMKGQMFDSKAQAEMGSNTKDRMYDSKTFQTEMGKSNLPASQCMPESGNTASQS